MQTLAERWTYVLERSIHCDKEASNTLYVLLTVRGGSVKWLFPWLELQNLTAVCTQKVRKISLVERA